MDRQDRGPVPRRAAPACGVARLGGSVDLAPFRERCQVAPGVPMGRQRVADGAVLVLVVVSALEGRHLHCDAGEVGNRVSREIEALLNRPEKRLGVQDVVGHLRPADGRHDRQALQRGQYRGTLHGPAILRVHDGPRGINRSGLTSGAKQGGRLGAAFRSFHAQADDFAAPGVEDQVQVPQRSPHWRLEVADVPASDLTRARFSMRRRHPPVRRGGSPPVSQLLHLPEHSVIRLLLGEMLSRMGQTGTILRSERSAYGS